MTEMLIFLEGPASFWVEPLQTMVDSVMSTIPGEEVLKKNKNRKYRNRIVSNRVESLERKGPRSRHSEVPVLKTAVIRVHGGGWRTGL